MLYVYTVCVCSHELCIALMCVCVCALKVERILEEKIEELSAVKVKQVR